MRNLHLAVVVTGAIAIGTTAPVLAKKDKEQDPYTACGNKAREQGISGKSAVSAFVADCVAQKHEAKANSPKDKASRAVGDLERPRKGKKTEKIKKK